MTPKSGCPCLAPFLSSNLEFFKPTLRWGTETKTNFPRDFRDTRYWGRGLPQQRLALVWKVESNLRRKQGQTVGRMSLGEVTESQGGVSSPLAQAYTMVSSQAATG